MFVLKKVLSIQLICTVAMLSCVATGLPIDQERSVVLLRDENGISREFVVNVWRTGEGLPVNDIQELKETRDGFLWIGTYRGLIRFDGVRFQTFLATPGGRRFGARVGPLELDDEGTLWAVPDQVGVVRVDSPTRFTELLTNDNRLKVRIESLCYDGDGGMLWVDGNGGVGRFSSTAPYHLQRIKADFPTGNAKWVRDFEGRVWLVTPRHLRLYEEGRWREVYYSEHAMTVAPRRAGGLWVAHEAKLFSVTADGSREAVLDLPWYGQTRVSCMMEDDQNRVWVGTVAQGLYCYDTAGKQFQQVTAGTSSITCLLEDAQDNVWAGTRGGGLIRVRKRHFFREGVREGLPNEYVRSLCQDIQGRIWMTMDEGSLGWWKNGIWKEVSPPGGWGGKEPVAVCPSKDGGVWISVSDRSIWRWKGGKLSRVRTKPLPESGADILEDKNGNVWLVTNNSGLVRIRGDEVTRYTIRDGLPSGHMRRIIEDESGTLWAGDWEGGIARFEGGKWVTARKQSGHQDAVRSMVSSGDALWIGTSVGGLLRLKDGKTSRVTPDDGLPDLCVQQLILDGHGSLWGATTHKLFCISLEELNAVMDGRRSLAEFIIYGRSDGLPDVSFSPWNDPRCWLTKDGELWFATANGVIHCRPDAWPTTPVPTAMIEQVLLNGKPVERDELLHLRPGAGRLDFRFTAPCLTAPERVRFRYQLSGVDDDWVDAGTDRSVTYANLPPGKHTFRVIASSPESVWSTEFASIRLAVHPFFWQQSWFLAAVAAAVAGGGALTLRRAAVRRLNRRLEQLRQQQALDRERARIAQDIHDELGANLTSIGLLADLGRRHRNDPGAVVRELDQISQTARESVSAMDAIVWALNPRNDSLDHFANYVAQFTRDFFRPTGIRTRLEVPPDLPSEHLSSDTRHQLFLLVKESFNNIVRHAQATEVNLTIACTEGRLRLIIEDDGKGISDETMREGANGLANLRERIERLGGVLWIKGKGRKGTRLEFILPLWKRKTT